MEKNETERKALDKDFREKLRTLVLPIAFYQFMTATVSASDAFMLGSLEQASLSAVSLAGQITFVFGLFIATLTIGANILAAQYWGKKDKDTVEKIFGYVTGLSLIIATIFTLGALIFPEQLMQIFTTDATLIERGGEYLRLVAPSFLLMGIVEMYLCMFRNTDRTILSVKISCSIVVLDICLNAVMIYGLFGLPRMGIAGAAVSTVISRVVQLAWCVAVSLRGDTVRLRLRYLRGCSKVLKADFRQYTLPVLGNEIVWGGGVTAYSVIMGHLGTDAVAAFAIASTVRNLLACFAIGLSAGGGIMIGNLLGDKEFEKAKLYGGKLSRAAIAAGIITGLLAIASTPILFHIVELSESSKGYLVGMMLMSAYYLIGKHVNATLIGGIFCAGGDSKFGFKCDAITMWLVCVPLGAIAAFILDLPVLAVCFILYLDEMVKLPAVYKNYKKYNWIQNITKEENEL